MDKTLSHLRQAYVELLVQILFVCVVLDTASGHYHCMKASLDITFRFTSICGHFSCALFFCQVITIYSHGGLVESHNIPRCLTGYRDSLGFSSQIMPDNLNCYVTRLISHAANEGWLLSCNLEKFAMLFLFVEVRYYCRVFFSVTVIFSWRMSSMCKTGLCL